jgi:hypothetical protein
MPDNLPEPVERFYRQVYGDRIPVITSAVISGRATLQLNVNAPKLQARFRFTHRAGYDYRHYIEATFFTQPLMKVNEHYVDGKGRLDLPFGVFEGPKVEQAANQGLWAEAAWMPSIWITDGRVRWEAVDDETALLFVPYGDGEQQFTVRFDPATGTLRYMETMRYRDTDEKAQKILWITESLGDKMITVNGATFPAVGAATWIDMGKPWAVFTVEEIVYNVDVSEYIRQTGP